MLTIAHIFLGNHVLKETHIKLFLFEPSETG
jgi:hypothetical protein